jgi:hypothetical protein
MATTTEGNCGAQWKLFTALEGVELHSALLKRLDCKRCQCQSMNLTLLVAHATHSFIYPAFRLHCTESGPILQLFRPAIDLFFRAGDHLSAAPSQAPVSPSVQATDAGAVTPSEQVG